jgi:two-component system response regulator PhoP
MKKTILICDDEEGIRESLKLIFEKEYALLFAANGNEAIDILNKNDIDIAIMDIKMPRMDGIETMRKLKEINPGLRILVTSGYKSVETAKEAVAAGASDYMVKPFDMRELMARCKALVRRSYGRAAPVIEIADISIDTARHQVMFRGRSVRLSAMEYRLLEYLAMRSGEVVSKADIAEHLYSSYSENFSNVVEVYICSLRKKLSSGSNRELIHTLRNQGYVLGELPA